LYDKESGNFIRGNKVLVDPKDLGHSEFLDDILKTEFDIKKVKKTTGGYEWNPFELLGAYPNSSSYIGKSYKNTQYGLRRDDKYCQKIDLEHLNNPDLMFNKKGAIFTDAEKTCKMNIFIKIMFLATVYAAAKSYGRLPFNSAALKKAQKTFETTKVKIFL